MMELVLFGGSGHGRAVLDMALRSGASIAAVVDPSAAVEPVPGAALVRSDAEGARLATDRGCGGVLGIGDNRRRLALMEELCDWGVELTPIVARTATVSPEAEVGPGTVVMEHAHVGPRSTLGAACVVNTGAVIEHDCALGTGVHCAPGAKLGGGVTCGDRALVGLGAAIRPLTRIGSDATVGTGAVVVADIGANATVVGNPAQPIGGGR